MHGINGMKYGKHQILLIISQLVVAVGLSLNIANLIGYVRCKKDAGKKIKTFAGNFLGRQLLNQVCCPHLGESELSTLLGDEKDERDA